MGLGEADTSATRLFGGGFRVRWSGPRKEHEGPEPPPEPPERTILVEGFDVQVGDAGRYIVTRVDGKAVPVTVEEYKERLAERLVEEAPTLAAQFAHGGTDGLENPQIFQTPEIAKAGGLEALRSLGKPADILRETKERMFSA